MHGLRVSGGALRGRKLRVDPRAGVRPTSDRARQAYFNIVSDLVLDSRFLDLYAGSGIFSFEAVSRGASEALALGLVHQVANLDVLDATVDATLGELLSGGPQAQGEIKALFAQLEVGPVTDEVRELTAQTISRVRGSDEAREGFAAFLDKRPANWVPE